jgi:hypothetical protein
MFIFILSIACAAVACWWVVSTLQKRGRLFPAAHLNSPVVGALSLAEFHDRFDGGGG